MRAYFIHQICMLLCLIACGETGNLHFKEGEIQNLGSDMNFSSLRDEVLEPKCIGCHSNYKAYAIVSSIAEKILDSVEAGRMPKNSSPLSKAEIDFIRDWISAGKPKGATNNVPASETEKIYATILGPKCVQCHNPNGEAKFLDLSNRQVIWDRRSEILNFEAPEKSYLIEVITDPEEPMPPSYSKLERLTEEEVARITDWIRKGMP